MIGVVELSLILIGTVIFYFLQNLWINRRILYYGYKMDGNFLSGLWFSFQYNFGTKKGLMEAWFKELRNNGPITKMWAMDRMVVTLTRPEDIEKVFSVALEKEPGYRRFFGIVLFDGLLTAPAHIWKKHRKAINYTFNQKIIESYCDIFVQYSQNLVKTLGKQADSGLVELFPIVSNNHLNLTCETAMGIKVKDVSEKQEYTEWIRTAEDIIGSRIFNPLLHYDILWNRTNLSEKLDKIVVDSYDFVRKVIKARKQATQDLSTIEEDASIGLLTKKKIFLDHLIQLTNDGSWTDQELAEEVQMFVVAGSETTALTECYALVFIAMHPHIQHLLHQEIDEIFGDDPHREIHLEDLNRMEYLERVLKETMRLCPLAFAPARYMIRDVHIGETLIPKGASVAAAVLYVHRNPEIYPEPLKFDPDRFLPEEAEKRHRYAYLPFSGGPRSCIGYKQAMLTMKAVISSILREFILTDSEMKSVDEVSFNFDILLSSEKGYRIAYKHRK